MINPMIKALRKRIREIRIERSELLTEQRIARNTIDKIKEEVLNGEA